MHHYCYYDTERKTWCLFEMKSLRLNKMWADWTTIHNCHECEHVERSKNEHFVRFNGENYFVIDCSSDDGYDELFKLGFELGIRKEREE